MTTNTLYRFAAISAAALAAASAQAQQDELVEKNPFLPPGYGKKVEAPPPQPRPEPPVARELEFRGVYEWNGVTRVGVFIKESKTSYWIPLEQSVENIEVVSFDPDSKSVVVNYDGRRDTLEMSTPSLQPMAVPQANANPQQRNGPQRPQARPQRNDGNQRATVPRRRVVLPRRTN